MVCEQKRETLTRALQAPLNMPLCCSAPCALRIIILLFATAAAGRATQQQCAATDTRCKSGVAIARALRNGRALTRRGRFDEATAQFRAAIQLDPERADAHHALGLSLNEHFAATFMRARRAQGSHQSQQTRGLPSRDANQGQLMLLAQGALSC